MRKTTAHWLLVYGGTILTQDGASPRVEALLARDGVIVATGPRDDMESLARHWAAEMPVKALDLEGATAMPGFIDAHIHLLGWASSLDRVPLGNATTRAEIVRRVASAVGSAVPGSWVQGWGWDHSLWDDTDGGFPDASVLDAVAPDVPVWLRRKDGHMAWMNSKAMSLAGLNAGTEAPPGGLIGRDVHGAPNGLLFENAMDLVDHVVPAMDLATAINTLRRRVADLHRMGVTGVHIPEGRLTFQALQDLDAMGELGLRASMMLPFDTLSQCVDAGLRTGFGSERLRVGHVKLFVDGSLGSETAAMFDPFIGSAGNRGVLTMTLDQLHGGVALASRSGIAPAVHAIGDRANSVVLDAFEATRDLWHPAGLRPRIEHVQVLHVDDVPRFRKLGVVASMQPIHATQDMDQVDRLWGDRGRYAYAFASLAATGAVLAFGSDAPVETPDPLVGVAAAVTRQRPGGDPPGGWYPEERLTIGQTLAAYTIGAAFAGGDEGRLGQLIPGARADLAIVDRDPVRTPMEDLSSIRVVATVFDGEVVYRA